VSVGKAGDVAVVAVVALDGTSVVVGPVGRTEGSTVEVGRVVYAQLLAGVDESVAMAKVELEQTQYALVIPESGSAF